MSYIGRTPIVGNFVKLDAITTSATTTFNLLNGGVAYFPQSANNCIVSLNGVIQSPTSAYTISGSTIVFSDALTSSDTIDFILVLGDVLNIGTPSDGTITSAKLASGVSGLISWQSVKTSGFTAVAGNGYPCNTTSASFTVTLPSSATAGDTIIIVDYAGTSATNNIVLNANGLKINSSTTNKVLNTAREAVTLTYIDSTQGWLLTSDSQITLPNQPYSIDFLVVAGGGGGGSGASDNYARGGGGGGGYRTSTQSVAAGTVITVTVGDGGGVATNGSDSSISGSGLTTITSAGGGSGAYRAGNNQSGYAGTAGGSGGGGASSDTPSVATGAAGTGNTPSTSPSQGNDGGTGTTSGSTGGGGGGGAGATGSNASTSTGGNGGNGTASSITGSSVTYSGGGGGGSGFSTTNGTTAGTGGTGGGGNGSNTGNGTSGTANLGGGGGGAKGGQTSGSGGKGVVILSVPTASYSSTSTGSPTVTTSGSNTILKFTGSGSYTA